MQQQNAQHTYFNTNFSSEDLKKINFSKKLEYCEIFFSQKFEYHEV